MRIVIDLQGRQSSGSKNRGIGRYSLAISKAIARNKKNHEVIIVLSSAFPNEAEEIRSEFKDLLPYKNIVTWSCSGDTSFLTAEKRHRKTAELDRELFLLDLKPDIIYIASLFEGHNDSVVTSINTVLSDVPVAATLYDLIPLIHEKNYLDHHANFKQWYLEKIEHAKRADLLLAISESSRQEALTYLDCKPDEVVNIGTAADDQFYQITLSKSERSKLLSRYNLKDDFLMYTGGIDHRKNIEGLIQAYALLPGSLRSRHQLAIVCSIDKNKREVLEALVKKEGLDNNEVIFTGFISEEDLIGLYNLCKAFIFPSWHEGFGLPALEAMWCGAPVIAADSSSLPEVVGWNEALFDPYSNQAMAKMIERVLTDELFRAKLRKNGSRQIQKFSWDISAQKAIEAFEKAKKIPHRNKPEAERLKLAYISSLPPKQSHSFNKNIELISQLNQCYDIDMVISQANLPNQWIPEYVNIVDVQTFRDNSNYDRVLYHFNNSEFYCYMLALLLEVPGVAILSNPSLSSETHCDNRSPGPEYINNQIILDYAKGTIVHSKSETKQLAQEIEKHYAKKRRKREGFSELQERVAKAEKKAIDAKKKALEAEAKAKEMEDLYSRICNSFSYRVTKPLRNTKYLIGKISKKRIE